MKTQYNFKIEDKLKQELDLLQEQSGTTGKEDFLSKLLDGYKHCKVNNIETNIDLSKFESVSKQTKIIILDAFKHILSTIESNNTNNKQQALLLEKDKVTILNERKSFKEQINNINAQHNEELLNLDKEQKEQLLLKNDEISKLKLNIRDIEKSKNILSLQLINIKKELVQVQSIAEQVQNITKSNQELRVELSKSTNIYNQRLLDLDKEQKEQLLLKNDNIKEQLEQIKKLEENKFKSEFLSDNKDKEIEILKKELEELKNETINKDDRARELEKDNIILNTRLEIINEKQLNKG
jgi:hypothetical protein